MKTLVALTITLLLFSCGSSDKTVADTGKHDSMSPRDSLKQQFSQLPSPNDPKQFKWFYSLFANGITGNNMNGTLNKFIDSTNGMYIIESGGAIPSFTQVKNFDTWKSAVTGKTIYDMLRSSIICDPKDEDLPMVNCDSASRWSKSGCFMQAVNRFKDQKPWQYSHLTTTDEKNVIALAQNISRTVVITAAHCRLYFSLVNGNWYLSFADFSVPCEA